MLDRALRNESHRNNEFCTQRPRGDRLSLQLRKHIKCNGHVFIRDGMMILLSRCDTGMGR